MTEGQQQTLLNAVAASVVAHGMLFLPWPQWDVAPRQEPARATLAVTYVESLLKRADAQPPIEEMDTAPVETTTVAVKVAAAEPWVEPRLEQGPDGLPEADPIPALPDRTGREPVAAFRTPPPIPAHLRSNPSYMSYYQVVRDRIRRIANRNRPRPFEPGDVGLWFVVAANGELQDIGGLALRGGAHARLQRVAETAVRQAAPFPPFPPTLPQRAIPFHVVISFEPTPTGR